MNKNEKKEKKEQKMEAAKRKKDVKSVAPILVSKIMPIVNFNEEGNFFVMENGNLMDLYEINCKDLLSLQDDELRLDNLTWDRLYKTYAGDLKIISFNFATDTHKQAENIDYLMSRTENPVYKSFLAAKRDEAIFINQNRFDKEFCLMFFAKTEDELRERRASIFGTMSRTRYPLLKRLELDKKQAIIYKLCNQSEGME